MVSESDPRAQEELTPGPGGPNSMERCRSAPIEPVKNLPSQISYEIRIGLPRLRCVPFLPALAHIADISTALVQAAYHVHVSLGPSDLMVRAQRLSPDKSQISMVGKTGAGPGVCKLLARNLRIR